MLRAPVGPQEVAWDLDGDDHDADQREADSAHGVAVGPQPVGTPDHQVDAGDEAHDPPDQEAPLAGVAPEGAALVCRGVAAVDEDAGDDDRANASHDRTDRHAAGTRQLTNAEGHSDHRPSDAVYDNTQTAHR